VDKIDQHILSDQYDDRERYLPAARAARFLGVKLPTLYAYVSRGLVRSAREGEGRERRYLRDDLEHLRARKRERRAAGPVSDALRWGEPVLESAISAITPEGPAYRGRPAVELAAAGVAFEAVAELLWTGELPGRSPRWECDGFGIPVTRLEALAPRDSTPLTWLSVLVPAIAARDHGRFAAEPALVLPRARSLVRRMAAALALPVAPERVTRALEASSVARTIALATRGSRDAEVARAIDQALVLVADHELNVSAFAARVAASAGADVYACVSAALAALSGPKHGGHIERVEALVAEAGSPERAAQVVHERARRGEAIPGFGHPFYPSGDPRAKLLFEAAEALAPKAKAVRAVVAIADAMVQAGRGLPNLDAGLVAVSAALGLPPGSGAALFAVGRTAGWVAHILEQYEAGFLIRPRALYRPRPAATPGQGTSPSRLSPSGRGRPKGG
jgi:citrate synthase